MIGDVGAPMHNILFPLLFSHEHSLDIISIDFLSIEQDKNLSKWADISLNFIDVKKFLKSNFIK